jgi:hypothetical protein
MASQNSECTVLFKMMTMLNQIKLYHWQTLSHPRHVATDNLYDKLNDLIDKFIESLTGRLIINNKNPQYRIQLNDPLVLKNISYVDGVDKTGYKMIMDYINYLESPELNIIIDQYSDLLNIRDEMLGELNKVAYLFSLN